MLTCIGHNMDKEERNADSVSKDRLVAGPQSPASFQMSCHCLHRDTFSQIPALVNVISWDCLLGLVSALLSTRGGGVFHRSYCHASSSVDIDLHLAPSP